MSAVSAVSVRPLPLKVEEQIVDGVLFDKFIAVANRAAEGDGVCMGGSVLNG